MENIRNLVIYQIVLLYLSIPMTPMLSGNELVNGGARVLSLENYDKLTISILEEAYRMKFPKNIVLETVSIVGGKDWTLYTKFRMKKDQIENLKNNLNFSVNYIMKDNRVFKTDYNHPDLNWWAINEADVDFVLLDKKSYTKIIIMKPINNDISVFAYTDGGSKGFAKELWELFNNKGKVEKEGAFFRGKNTVRP